MKRISIAVLLGGILISSSGCWESPRTVRPANDLGTQNTSVNNSNANRVSYVSNSTPASNSNMTKPTETGFFANLPSGFQNPTDDVGKRLRNMALCLLHAEGFSSENRRF
ncbi:MAG: hypothetical protein KF685_01145 [Acidobacteria bacterium]|nr:hypothetical protein [Acidobacteriota bacterium]